MAEIRWDIRRGADIYRQISDSRLRRWISTGKIKPGEVVVWRSGFSGWRRPEELEELIPYFRRYEKDQLRKIRRREPVRKALSGKTQIKNILIIDDEKDLCQLLGDALSSHGFNVEFANTRREAMSSLKSRLPDLVFLDLKLPDGDGLRLLSSIKKINPGTTVNIISAYGTEEVRDKARKFGAYGFIDKPFSEEDILRSIRKLRKAGAS
ncbi:MAG: response regulator [Thermodesulfovibrionales bacterium]|nr:response regulator [Thermodesulfovibrionales bacterium]